MSSISIGINSPLPDEKISQRFGLLQQVLSNFERSHYVINFNYNKQNMSLLSKVKKTLQVGVFKTIYFNFKYLPFKQALKFPILVSKNVCLEKTNGQVLIDHPARPGLIKIGFGHVGIFDKIKSRCIWEVSGTVIFKGEANIGHGSKISVGGILVLGGGFNITAESSILASNYIQFGSNCLLSWDILVMDTDFHKIIDKSGSVLNHSDAIVIGDKVWVGCRCLILKGAVIPNGCVIGANSFLSKKLENENTIYGGNPIRILNNQEICWEE